MYCLDTSQYVIKFTVLCPSGFVSPHLRFLFMSHSIHYPTPLLLYRVTGFIVYCFFLILLLFLSSNDPPLPPVLLCLYFYVYYQSNCTEDSF